MPRGPTTTSGNKFMDKLEHEIKENNYKLKIK